MIGSRLVVADSPMMTLHHHNTADFVSASSLGPKIRPVLPLVVSSLIMG